MAFCCECKYYHWSKIAEEWQCWHDNCIHEGEERNELMFACDKFEEGERCD